MNRRLPRILLLVLLCLVLITGWVTTAVAQAPIPTNTPTAVPTLIGLSSGDQIPFSQLLSSDLILNGPFDSNIVQFAVPAVWRLNQAPQLELDMAISFNAPVATPTSQASIGVVGTLTVQMNNVLIAVIPLDRAGETTQRLLIPLTAMQSTRTDGLMELRFSLDSTLACDYNENLVVRIHTSSVITLPHVSQTPDTDLTQFPTPIFQQGLTFSNSALIVIPDHPSANELQSALTLAAGISKLTAGGLSLDLVTIGQLTPQQAINNHLILVGKASSLSPMLAQLQLPMPVINGNLRNTGGGVDDGIVQMVASPWSPDRVVLLVTGNTDAGTLKAAQATSTGVFRPNVFPNLAIVQQVQAAPQTVSVPVDQTIQELGYGTITLNSLGVNSVNFSFNVPAGQTLEKGAYFDLLYGHSALLNYSRSGIVALVNGEPIGSVVLSDITASTAVNDAKFLIPPAVVHAGKNNIEIRADLIPVDKCSSPNLGGTYMNIWAGSNLHLPLLPTPINTSSNFDLANYPAPLDYDPTLGNTAFVLPKDDLQSWRSALAISSYLGLASQGPVTTLGAFYADSLPAAERPKYNLLIIGRPSMLPIISELNNALPAPFANNSDVAREPDMQVTYSIAPNTNLGYVELLSSPWGNNKVIIAALGNTQQGVAWAASHLIAPLSYTLKGNFAVINGTRVITTDTRVASIAPLASTAVPGSAPAVQAVAPAVNLGAPVMGYRPGWLLPALIVTVVLILVTVLVAVYINWLHNHPGKVTNPLDNLLNHNKKE